MAKEVIKITRPSGAAFVGMDTFKDRESVHKLQGFTSSVTGKDIK
jgi:hypothetical protein